MGQVRQITVDGIDYIVEFDTIAGNPGVIWVYDTEGQKVASAEWDDMDEAVHARFFDVDGHLEEHDARQADLFKSDWREVARWLCCVHPNN